MVELFRKIKDNLLKLTKILYKPLHGYFMSKTNKIDSWNILIKGLDKDYQNKRRNYEANYNTSRRS